MEKQKNLLLAQQRVEQMKLANQQPENLTHSGSFVSSPGFFYPVAARGFREIAIGSNVHGGLHQLKTNSFAAFFAGRELVALNSKHFMGQAMLIVRGSVDPRCEYIFPRFEPIRHVFASMGEQKNFRGNGQENQCCWTSIH